ncbi:hypothetical protein AB0103_26650, partial [Klebsiella pneumoniae]
ERADEQQPFPMEAEVGVADVRGLRQHRPGCDRKGDGDGELDDDQRATQPCSGATTARCARRGQHRSGTETRQDEGGVQTGHQRDHQDQRDHGK